MPDLTPMTREEKFLNGDTDLTPITRREHFYAGTESELPEPDPITREEWFIQKYRGGGGGDITVESLSVTENGTYTAPSGKAYSPVEVDVPLPQNAYLKKTATTSMSDAVRLPVASAVVSVTDKDKAELFLATDGVVSEDNTPYLYRQSPSGKSCVDLSVVGGTVAWNQLVQNGNFASTDGWAVSNATMSVSNNKMTLSGNTNSFISLYCYTGYYVSIISNHKYLITAKVSTTASGDIAVLPTGGFGGGYKAFPASTTAKNVAFIYNANSTTDAIMQVRFIASTSGTSESITATIENYNCIDLTQMLGTTIADYIYTLEQSTAGSGIAWLKANGFLAKDYYAYDSGSLQSVNVASRKVYDSNDTLVATYPLDSDLTLRGIPKLDANNKLYYDGDTYESDGSVKRKYGVRAYESGDESLADTITDGTNTVYKLTTPTTESATPYTNPQLVGSTEEFIDTRDVPIPVGQNSKYVNGNIYIKYLDSVTTGDIELADENAIIPLENTTYISSNGSASIDYWSKEV